MIVLAFDQAPKRTGFAYGPDVPGTKPNWGVRDFPSFGEHEDRLYLAYRYKFIQPLFNEVKPGYVFYEQILKGNPITEYQQYAIWSAIISECADRGIPAEQLTIPQWRSHALGKHNRPLWGVDGTGKNGEPLSWFKLAAMMACADLGWYIDSHDGAEAALQWDFGCCCTSSKYMEATEARVARKRVWRENEDRAFKENKR